MSKAKRDIYNEITDKVINRLEEMERAGRRDKWIKPWTDILPTGFPRNGVTRRAYRGVNVLICMISGFSSPDWYTFNQIKKIKGATLRKGSKGTQLTFWKQILIEDKETEEKKRIPILRFYYVFNREQIDGLPPVAPVVEVPEPIRMGEVEEYIGSLGGIVREESNRASYSPTFDVINMPPAKAFKDIGSYYSTFLHEYAHWTGHETRLNRPMSGSFGTPSYAEEELVAELASAFLCLDLGIEGNLQHPEYIAHWLQKLYGDKKFIFKAAAEAAKAHEFLNTVAGREGLHEEYTEEEVAA